MELVPKCFSLVPPGTVNRRGYLKARLHYETQLNSTVVADKEQGPKTIQSLGLGLEYTKTAVLDPAETELSVESHCVAWPLVVIESRRHGTIEKVEPCHIMN